MEIQDQETSIKCSFSRMLFFEIWASKTVTFSKKSQHVLEVLLKSINNIEDINVKPLDSCILKLCKSMNHFWKKVNRTKSKLLLQYSDWLNAIECVVLTRSVKQGCTQKLESEPGPSRGRPRKKFSDLSNRSKRRRLVELSQVDDSAVNVLRNASASDTSNRSLDISADEVLSLFVEAKLTKHQYLLIKNFINDKTSCNILPPYQRVLDSKKKCYPENISISDSTAEVELQSLLDHTVSRILHLQKNVLDTVPVDALNNLSLIGKWGFDGSTGHSQYKQHFSDSALDDNSLFVTSYVPLQLVVNIESEDNTKILWKNPRPSSTRYCRPIRFQFLKETSEVSLQEEAYFREKINNLIPTTFKIDDRYFKIKHNIQLTMVDGKVCSALSESSSSKCYLCGATPKEMNNIDLCLQKPIEVSHYQFGLSPHSWIRFFEYFLHLAYRIDIKKWQVRSVEEKKMLADRKVYVQRQFRSRLGLIVDKPQSGGSGTSNDGNTARKFFINSDVSAEITGLSKGLIDRCCTILQALASGFNIDTNKYREFALETACQLVQEYPWYNLPASIHKVLIHGSEIAEHALLSIGELSEEAADSNNKIIKSFRRNHTRKISRVLTNTALMNRLLLSSDPFITGLRKLPRQNKSLLSKQVLNLLRT